MINRICSKSSYSLPTESHAEAPKPHARRADVCAQGELPVCSPNAFCLTALRTRARGCEKVRSLRRGYVPRPLLDEHEGVLHASVVHKKRNFAPLVKYPLKHLQMQMQMQMQQQKDNTSKSKSRCNK